MRLPKIILFVICLALAGCMYERSLGPKPVIQYSHKKYTVRNSFGSHTYRPDNRYKINRRYRNGRASYYGGKFNGRKAAGCIIYDEKQLLAAHPTAVIPSIAKVTRVDNSKEVYVIIVDRGPFAKGRVCDLSVGAAKAIGLTKEGHAPVKIEILPEHSKILGKHWKKFLHKRLPDALFEHIKNRKSLYRYLESVR